MRLQMNERYTLYPARLYGNNRSPEHWIVVFQQYLEIEIGAVHPLQALHRSTYAPGVVLMIVREISQPNRVAEEYFSNAWYHLLQVVLTCAMFGGALMNISMAGMPVPLHIILFEQNGVVSIVAC